MGHGTGTGRAGELFKTPAMGEPSYIDGSGPGNCAVGVWKRLLGGLRDVAQGFDFHVSSNVDFG